MRDERIAFHLVSTDGTYTYSRNIRFGRELNIVDKSHTYVVIPMCICMWRGTKFIGSHQSPDESPVCPVEVALSQSSNQYDTYTVVCRTSRAMHRTQVIHARSRLSMACDWPNGSRSKDHCSRDSVGGRGLLSFLTPPRRVEFALAAVLGSPLSST